MCGDTVMGCFLDGSISLCSGGVFVCLIVALLCYGDIIGVVARFGD